MQPNLCESFRSKRTLKNLPFGDFSPFKRPELVPLGRRMSGCVVLVTVNHDNLPFLMTLFQCSLAFNRGLFIETPFYAKVGDRQLSSLVTRSPIQQRTNQHARTKGGFTGEGSYNVSIRVSPWLTEGSPLYKVQ